MFKTMQFNTMLKAISRCLLMLIFSSVGLAIAQSKDVHPKKINLVYDVTRNGQPFATVTESYQQTGNEYHIVSITKGLGVYALLGERKLTSDGTVTAGGLKPSRFELRQGDNAKKWLFTDFDWANSTLNMTVKGNVNAVPLLAGTQDLASFSYQFMNQFMFSPSAQKEQNSVALNVTTGKKLRLYEYKVAARDVLLTLAAGTFKTLQLVSADAESGDDKQLWLASEQFYLPVRIVIHDENGGVVEQNLKSLQLD